MFTVRWTRRAIRRLTQIWVDAHDQAAVTTAVARIDRLLAVDPGNQGESRPGRKRVMFVSPLGVKFRVYPQEGIVRVLSVWRITR
jgi:plasmid stabilization system protein ParE